MSAFDTQWVDPAPRAWDQLTHADRQQIRYDMGSCYDWMAEFSWRLGLTVSGHPEHGTTWYAQDALASESNISTIQLGAA